MRGDARVVERAGWYQLITPSDTSGSLNEVVHGDCPTDTDRVIEHTIRSFQGRPFKWCVWPWSRPSDLAARLDQRGLEHWEAQGMTIRTGGPGAELKVDVDPPFELAAAVWAEGWSEGADQVRSDLRSLVASDHRLFLAWVDGLPAGIAAYRLLGGAAYLHGAVVLERFRGRGAYRALIAARLQHLALHGVPLATTHARSHTSAPILARAGFATQFRYLVFRHGMR